MGDEILLLERDGAGQVRLLRRTRLPRRELRRWTDQMTAALERRTLDDKTFRSLAAPLAAALAPPQEQHPVAVYGLYGLLQGVPLAALPAEEGWLFSSTVPVVVPAGIRTRSGTSASRSTVFVVDPERNLPSGPRLEAFFRQLDPTARVLGGGDATRAAVREAFRTAHRLHLGTHGRYDPAFPRLSRLRLADGELLLGELAASMGATGSATPELVDLAGCHTGRWPATADRGHFGLAGAMARSGVPWVVGSRSALDDGVAAELAEAFYGFLSTGDPVPRAYGRALGELARHRRGVEWGGITLFSSDPGVKDPLDDSPRVERSVPRRHSELPEEGTR